MSFIAKCPYCNNAYQAEEAWLGQVMSCPTCGRQIVIQREEESAAPPPPKVEIKFTSRCPYCGSSYQAEESMLEQVMSCPICGKQIVIQRDSGNQTNNMIGSTSCFRSDCLQGTVQIAPSGSGEKLNEFPVVMLALPIVPAIIGLLIGVEIPWWGYVLYNTVFAVWDMKILSQAGYNDKKYLYVLGFIFVPLYLGVRAHLTKRWRWFVLWIISFFALFAISFTIGFLQELAKMAESGQLN